MTDAQAIHWYFGPGTDTEACSGSIDSYDGEMTAPSIMNQVVIEEGMNVGLFRSPTAQYGLGPQPQRTRP